EGAALNPGRPKLGTELEERIIARQNEAQPESEVLPGLPVTEPVDNRIRNYCGLVLPNTIQLCRRRERIPEPRRSRSQRRHVVGDPDCRRKDWRRSLGF